MNFILLIVIAFLILMLVKLFMKRAQKKSELIKQNDTIDERYNAQKILDQQRLDQLLDKVANKGIDALSTDEKAFLDRFAN
jgi:uncharacterized protein YpmS